MENSEVREGLAARIARPLRTSLFSTGPTGLTSDYIEVLPMPQSFAALYAHVAFSTMERAPILAPELRPRLFEILGGIARRRKCLLLKVGGVADHVHLLLSLHRETAISRIVGALKANSSNWIHRHIAGMEQFDWQDGYGAFSVSHSQVPRVGGYIGRQEIIHSGMSFKAEMRAMLTRHGIEYDERFIWR
jgi:putative transposase